MTRLLLSVLLFMLGYTMAFAQAPVDGFFKGKGNVDVGFGFGREKSSEYFAGTNVIDAFRTVYSASVFAGAGITDRLDAYASIPFVSLGKNNGLHDGSIFLKYMALETNMKNGKIHLNLAAGYSANLSDYETEGGSAIGQQAKTLDLRPIVHFQWNNGWFATGQFAYLLRGDPVPSSTTLALKVGKASADWYYDLWYVIQDSEPGRDYRGTPAPETFRQLSVDFHKVGATLYKPLTPKMGAYVGLGQVINGRNIPKGTGINLGMVFKVK